MKKLLILLLYVCSLVTSCYDDSFLNHLSFASDLGGRL